MPDNKSLADVACGAATVLGLGRLGTQPGLRNHLDPSLNPSDRLKGGRRNSSHP